MGNKLLIIGYVWPEPKSSAAGWRMLQLINSFKKLGYSITYATPCAKSDNAFDLSSINVNTETITLNCSSFDTYVKALNPSVVMFDRYMMEEQFGWRVSEQCPDALKILDTEDLHFLRKARQACYKAKQEWDDAMLYTDLAKRELASIYRCDVSLIISEYEMELLTSRFNVPKGLLYYLPFLEEEQPNDSIVNLPKFNERQHLISIGNFFHEPNWQAVLFLKQILWPKLKKALPGVECHIYGAYVSQKVTQLHNPKERFYVKGFAESVDEVMQNARVNMAYLPFGAGLKGKLIDAMKQGTPCAMSTTAAEAMFGNEAPNGFVENDIDTFVDKIKELYNNESLWEAAQENGFNILEKRFMLNNFENAFLERIAFLKTTIKTHRQTHFMGQVLQLNTMQSTKFMSKWIEAKNKD